MVSRSFRFTEMIARLIGCLVHTHGEWGGGAFLCMCDIVVSVWGGGGGGGCLVHTHGDV